MSDLPEPEILRGEKPRLLQQVHAATGLLQYSRRTEEVYAHWIKRFSSWSGKRHPATLGETEVSAFPGHLAVKLNFAAATQNQAAATHGNEAAGFHAFWTAPAA